MSARGAASMGGARRRAAGLVATLALALGAAGAVLTTTAAPAGAAGRVSVSSDLGGATASLDGATTVQLSGSGFQSVQGGFGGIYVLFGWVSEPGGLGWSPSNGGATGATYVYVPDAESGQNAGYSRFIAFPGSSTAGEAHGEIAADGTWSASMVIPGPTFTGLDRDNNPTEVDCRAVTCGIITIGAHGVKNANNESFTPVSFAAPGGSGSSAAGAQEQATSAPTDAVTPAAGDAAAEGEAGEGGAEAEESAAPDVPATLGVDARTVVVGRVIAFTGQGFTPGEQVVASLSGGLAAAGPLVAGAAGEVAGVLTLPADIRTGSHTLSLVGAASGDSPEIVLTVVEDPVLAAAAAQAAAEEDAAGPGWQVLLAAGAGLVLLVLLVSSGVTALVRRRQRRRLEASDGEDGDDDEDGDDGYGDGGDGSGDPDEDGETRRRDSRPPWATVVGAGANGERP